VQLCHAAKATAARILATQKVGDRIRRIFAQWAIAYFGQFYKYYVAQNFGLLFSPKHRLCILILTKNGGATFWAIFFHKTHLVTLLLTQVVPITAKNLTNQDCNSLHNTKKYSSDRYWLVKQSRSRFYEILSAVIYMYIKL
jgi:hypothetical protein